MRFEVSLGEEKYDVEVRSTESGWHCRVDGAEVPINVTHIRPDVLSILLRGNSYTVRKDDKGALFVGANRYDPDVTDARSWRSRQQHALSHHGPQKLTASMPGKVVRLLAPAGTRVSAGQGVLVVEAMKMQNEIRSPRDGTVVKLYVREGVNVNPGEILAEIE